MTDSAADDGILSTGITSATSGTVHFGTLNLNANNFVTGTVAFTGSTLAWDPSTNKLTITLGTPSLPASLGTDATSHQPIYAADAGITGSSGIAISTANFNGTSATLF